MDGPQFDTLARRLAASGSRRRLLASALVVVGLATPGAAETKRRKHGRHHAQATPTAANSAAVPAADAPAAARHKPGRSCPTGWTACPVGKKRHRKHVCVDLKTDPQHCGACRTPCSADQSCMDGKCVGACAVGSHGCNGQCVSDGSIDHCGSSCAPCPTAPCSTPTCDGTRCRLDPIPGCCATDADCDDGDVCTIDTCDATDATCRHAPAPDMTPCGTGGACCASRCCAAPTNGIATCGAGGACAFACKVGFGDCDDDPRNGCEIALQTDPRHCGACPNACPAPPHGAATCVAGVCGIACDAGFHLCGGQCVAFGTEANCTGCGDVCPDGTTCQNGSCTPIVTCDCANFDNCSGHGVCTEACTCRCDPGWTGITCSDPAASPTCADYGTCAACQDHLTDGCEWCLLTLDGASDVCTTIDNCAEGVDVCSD